MSQPNPSIAMARAIVDQLVREDVARFVISPGSRSASLAIAAAEHPGTITIVALDERSAGFRALGAAKSTGLPAGVISTSGTAPANYLPAIVEADMSMTPLVVLSADRPAELRGVGANQTIDQTTLYRDRVRFFADVAAPGPEHDLNTEWRQVARDAAEAALGSSSGRPGPVHLNVAFREPTVPVSHDGRTSTPRYPYPIDETPVPGRIPDRQAQPAAVEIPSTSRGLVIAGEGSYSRDALAREANRLGWPLLATAQSDMRGGSVVSAYHHALSGGVPDHLTPEVVVTVGAIGPSQRLEDLVASTPVRVRVDAWGRTIDPRRNATHVVAADPAEILAGSDIGGDGSFAAHWQAVDLTLRKSVSEFVGSLDDPTGPGAVHQLNQVDWPALVAGSSLPIRDVDAHLSRGGVVIANRGASGIDGFNSTALGVADAIPGTVGITGDLGFLHDSNAFLNDSPSRCVFVVIDNNGGGLFDALPPARHAPDYERLFVAPHHRRLQLLAQFHNLEYRLVTSLSELEPAMSENGDAPTTLVHVPVDRGLDLMARQRLDELSSAEVALLES